MRLFRFPSIDGGVSGCSGGSGSGSCRRWWPATRTDTRRWHRDQSWRWSWGCSVGACHFRRDDTCDSDAGYRSQRSTKTSACQQHTLPLSRSWSQADVWGKLSIFLRLLVVSLFLHSHTCLLMKRLMFRFWRVNKLDDTYFSCFSFCFLLLFLEIQIHRKLLKIYKENAFLNKNIRRL